MKFKMTHLFLKKESTFFDEETAPDWLTSKNSIKGSTMDDRWFWENHILTLKIGEKKETDFQIIERIQ